MPPADDLDALVLALLTGRLDGLTRAQRWRLAVWLRTLARAAHAANFAGAGDVGALMCGRSIDGDAAAHDAASHTSEDP